MKRMTPESAVLRAVTDLLTVHRIWWMRNNTGTHVLEHSGRKRVFRAGRPGMADLLALPVQEYCRGCGARPAPRVPGWSKTMCCGRTTDEAHVPLWIECKAANGVQSDAQKEFQREVEQKGHVYLVARSSNDVWQWLTDSRVAK